MPPFLITVLPIRSPAEQSVPPDSSRGVSQHSLISRDEMRLGCTSTTTLAAFAASAIVMLSVRRYFDFSRALRHRIPTASYRCSRYIVAPWAWPTSHCWKRDPSSLGWLARFNLILDCQNQAIHALPMPPRLFLQVCGTVGNLKNRDCGSRPSLSGIL